MQYSFAMKQTIFQLTDASNQIVSLSIPTLKTLCMYTISQAIEAEQYSSDEVWQSLPPELKENLAKTIVGSYSFKSPELYVNGKNPGIKIENIITTPNLNYGITEIGQKLYLVDLYTRELIALNSKGYFETEFSHSGTYILYMSKSTKGYSKKSCYLQNIAAGITKELCLNDGYYKGEFCGDNYILFHNAHSENKKLMVYDIQKEKSTDVAIPDLWSLLTVIKDYCIVSTGNSYLGHKYQHLVKCSTASVVNKWSQIYQYQDTVSLYEPERLVAFLAAKKNSSIAQISRWDAPLDNKSMLPALVRIDNGAEIQTMCFANKGTWLVTGGDYHDGQLRVWNISRCKEAIAELFFVFNPKFTEKIYPISKLCCEGKRLMFQDGVGFIHTVNNVNYFLCRNYLKEKAASVENNNNVVPMEIDKN